MATAGMSPSESNLGAKSEDSSICDLLMRWEKGESEDMAGSSVVLRGCRLMNGGGLVGDGMSFREVLRWAWWGVAFGS